MDKVEWEIVRADIAMEKARLRQNGDWARWEEFQKQNNILPGIDRIPAGWIRTPRTPWRPSLPWGHREDR